jgi:hypothetical protein
VLVLILLMMVLLLGACSFSRGECVHIIVVVVVDDAVSSSAQACRAHARACVTRKEAAEARESSSPSFFHRALETVLTWGGVGYMMFGEGWRIRGWS